MKKIFTIFVIVMIVGTMFAGCDTKEEVVTEVDGFVNEIIVEDIIVEDIITENIIVEDIIEETVWISPEYRDEVEYNSRENEP